MPEMTVANGRLRGMTRKYGCQMAMDGSCLSRMVADGVKFACPLEMKGDRLRIFVTLFVVAQQKTDDTSEIPTPLVFVI